MRRSTVSLNTQARELILHPERTIALQRALFKSEIAVECGRVESKCHSAQDAFDERHESGEIGALEQRPMCDGKAKFAAFDCVPAHTCFCQSDEGERLFGEVLNLGAVTMQNMHCGCSRLHNKIRKTIVPGVQFPVIGPRCTADGNFNPVQCMDGTCYCVDPITGIRKDGESVELVTHPLSRLSCYDASLDLFPEQNIGQPPFNYTTPCFEEMEARVELIAQSEEDGFIVDFFSTIPECLPDGTYGRIAETTNGTKICVNEWGRQIEDYEALPGTKEFDTMDCKCALTSLVMSSSVEKPVCCKNGNYRPIQCRRGQCRCVDSDGRQIEKESTDVTTLSCHSEDWRIC